MYSGGRGSGSWIFWLGESLTMAMFLYNGLALTSPASIAGIAVLSSVFCLILGGRFWRYAIAVACQVVLAILAVLIFPVLEMILEEIMNEKLRKIGEKIRAHSKRMNMEKVK